MGTGAGGDYWEERTDDVPTGNDLQQEPAEDSALANPLGSDGAVMPKDRAKLRHIFRPSHRIEDNPETRERLLGYTRGDERYLGTDEELGHLWYADANKADQLWVEVREKTVKDAGLNAEGRPFNPRTGLRNDPKANGQWRGGR